MEKNVRKFAERIISDIDSANAEYIIEEAAIMKEFDRAFRFSKMGCTRTALHAWKKAKKMVSEFGETRLTPANVRLGQGVSIRLGDAQAAATVTKIEDGCITVRTDRAVLNPKAEIFFTAKGMVCQGYPTYVYSPDRNGMRYCFRWSRKNNVYGRPDSLMLIKGRDEFHVC